MYIIVHSGHTRQGLKCKLCRMNVHPDCQDQVPKCQPKSRLLRRQRSASELESRPFDTEDDSEYLLTTLYPVGLPKYFLVTRLKLHRGL